MMSTQHLRLTSTSEFLQTSKKHQRKLIKDINDVEVMTFRRKLAYGLRRVLPPLETPKIVEKEVENR
jgi:hypothetical protein